MLDGESVEEEKGTDWPSSQVSKGLTLSSHVSLSSPNRVSPLTEHPIAIRSVLWQRIQGFKHPIYIVDLAFQSSERTRTSLSGD
jgi:hypothetical protein